jgi:tRNA-dihydrouridine synthase B
MKNYLHTDFNIGTLNFSNRLIQGPLAGFSCAPFRELFSNFQAPAYCVTEMISAQDVLTKHSKHHRYLFKSPNEGKLAYQLSGNCPKTLLEAALHLEQQGADLIDINCGCPKPKIRKKGAGSALLDNPETLIKIIKQIKTQLTIPLTIKIRLQNTNEDILLAKKIEDAGADGLIIHGRTALDDYQTPCNYHAIQHIIEKVDIPCIANGDIKDITTLTHAYQHCQPAGFMISRAGTGRPWLFAELLTQQTIHMTLEQIIDLFIEHIEKLAILENEFKALLQARTLIKYYFRPQRNILRYAEIFAIESVESLKHYLCKNLLLC